MEPTSFKIGAAVLASPRSAAPGPMTRARQDSRFHAGKEAAFDTHVEPPPSRRRRATPFANHLSRAIFIHHTQKKQSSSTTPLCPPAPSSTQSPSAVMARLGRMMPTLSPTAYAYVSRPPSCLRLRQKLRSLSLFSFISYVCLLVSERRVAETSLEPRLSLSRIPAARKR